MALCYYPVHSFVSGYPYPEYAPIKGNNIVTQDEIVLGDESSNQRNTGIRYEKRGPNYGVLTQDIYTVRDLSQTIGVHHTTILEHIKAHRLKALYLGGPAGYRIHREDIIAWVRNLKDSE